MSEQTPQDTTQLAINLVDQWYFGTNNATMISPADRTVLYQRIAAVVQAERDRQSVAVAQAEIAGMMRAAQRLCRRCKPGDTLEWIEGAAYHTTTHHATGSTRKLCNAMAIRQLIEEAQDGNA